jgi:hypothetical protein
VGDRGCSELSEGLEEGLERGRLDFGGTNETQELGELRRLEFWGTDG